MQDMITNIAGVFDEGYTSIEVRTGDTAPKIEHPASLIMINTLW